MVGILDLPTELLVHCVNYATKLQPNRNSLRLTAKHIYEILGHEPVPNVVIFLSSPASLDRLVGIFLSVDLVSTWRLSRLTSRTMYDIVLAGSLETFVRFRSKMMSQTCSNYCMRISAQPGGHAIRDMYAICGEEARRISEFWSNVSYDHDNPTREQKLLLECYEEYSHWFTAQCLATRDDMHTTDCRRDEVVPTTQEGQIYKWVDQRKIPPREAAEGVGNKCFQLLIPWTRSGIRVE